MSLVDLPLLPLGKGRDLDAERGVECPGDLPAASDPDLVARARAAKAALGERVFVLGHHYQRDEVIQFADVTGDSFKLARDAAARPDAEFIVFCGVHFMAESADILTASEPAGGPARPGRRLLDGRHGPARARSRTPGTRWPTPASQDHVVPVTYMNSSADIKAFCGRNGGVGLHVVQRRRRAGVGVRPEGDSTRAPRCSSSPTSTSAATPPCSDGHLARRLRRVGPAAARRRPHRRGAARRADDPLEGPLLRARPLLRGRRRRAARQAPRHQDPGPPRVHARGGPQGRPGRLDRVHHQDHRGRASPARVGHRHRAQPGQAPGRRAPRQDDRLPRPQRLLLLDDEPHRPPAPRLGAGELVAGTVVNQIAVDPDTEADALVALQRMLDLPGKSHRD